MLLGGSAFIFALPTAHWVTGTGSTANCLISKMEVCFFENSLWHSSIITLHKLNQWCQLCLSTANRTRADVIRNLWLLSFFVKHKGEFKRGGQLVASYPATAVYGSRSQPARSRHKCVAETVTRTPTCKEHHIKLNTSILH